MIILHNGKFLIKDLKSKFGTLVLVRNPFIFTDAWNNVSI